MLAVWFYINKLVLKKLGLEHAFQPWGMAFLDHICSQIFVSPLIFSLDRVMMVVVPPIMLFFMTMGGKVYNCRYTAIGVVQSWSDPTTLLISEQVHIVERIQGRNL